jgi:outer membrane receptor protein involved in Fe transport
VLPEGISGFGQTLDAHIIDKAELLTGALPAEYGYRTAGVIDITTKTGNSGMGGKSSVIAGGDNTLGGNQEFYGSAGQANYFFSGTYDSGSRGIEPPTASAHALHDDTVQDKEFGYLSYAFTPYQRLSVIFGNATNRFEIPDNPGQPQNFALNGVSGFSSSSLDERQFEHNTYAVAALQGGLNEKTDYQLAFFTRYSDVLFKPDPVGDLIFNGIASRDERDSLTNGVQNDFTWRYNDVHTIRSGWMFSYEQAQSNSSSSVFPGFFDSGGGQDVQTGGTPFTLTQNSSIPAELFGAYLQDEWRLTDRLVVNYGARFDAYSAYVHDSQISPRIGIIYDATSSTRLHAGYARYFTPPPTELIAPVVVRQFMNTSAAAPNSGDSPVVPEKDNYFDMGVIQQFGGGFTGGVDAYYKQARHLLDEGQFGQALIFAPFNYEQGWVRGVEFTADYKRKDLSAYVNLAISKATGKGVESGQFNFSQDELDYIAGNAVHLDHDQLVSGSLGTSYNFHAVKYSADMTYGSGLRDGFANTGHLPFYAQMDVNAEHAFDMGSRYGLLEGKISVINLFDRVYEIRDGSGIGVFAPQFGTRRTFFVTLGKPF